jgi:hypothetical protein
MKLTYKITVKIQLVKRLLNPKVIKQMFLENKYSFLKNNKKYFIHGLMAQYRTSFEHHYPYLTQCKTALISKIIFLNNLN